MAAAPSILDRVELRRGGVWSSREGLSRQACIRVIDGTVWVTQEGDPGDYVLRAGEVFRGGGGRLVVVQAMEDAHLAVLPLAG